MAYNLRLPNGVLLKDIPDDVPDEEVRRKVLEEFPDLALKEKRTWGEAGSDILASLGSGLGQAAQFPDQLGRLITGERPREASEVSPDETPGLFKEGPGAVLGAYGKQLEDYGQAQKSAILRAKEQARAEKIQKAEGFTDEFITSIKETAKDPALISSFFFEQIPSLIGSYGFGMFTKGGAKLLMRNATEEALSKYGVRGAVAGNAVMQGTDVGSDTYEQLYKQLRAQGMPEEEAHGVALGKGRIAAIEAAAVSLAATKGLDKLGGASIERALMGRRVPGQGFVKGLTGEALSEGIEEGGGAFAKNYNIKDVIPETDLMKGVGSAAGLGALGGALLGGGAGAISGGNLPNVPAGTLLPPTQPPAPPAQPPVVQPAQPQGAMPPSMPMPPAAPAAPGVAANPNAPVGPYSPIKLTPEGTPERDLAGVVPQGQLADPKQLVGPDRPAGELPPQVQGELPMGGQGELFRGQAPQQPEQTPAQTPKAPAPETIGGFLRKVIDIAKADPSTSKVMRGNNSSTAKIVEERVQNLITANPELDLAAAMEQLYQQNKLGQGRALSPAQQELLDAAYQRLTGLDIEEGIRNRSFMAAPQGELFPGEGNAEPPAATPNAPGEAPPDVGVPGQPQPPATPQGTPGGVGPRVVPGGVPAGTPPTGTGTQPIALDPAVEWDRHRDPAQPDYDQLSPEEQAAWNKSVAAGRSTGTNFAKVMKAHLDRKAGEQGKSEAEIKAAFTKHGQEMAADIESDIKGKTFSQVLKFLSQSGPESNRQIAKALYNRAKELTKLGYTFKFTVPTSRAEILKVGGYDPGVLGRVQPRGKYIDISVAGKGSGQPFGAQYRTTTHESIHAVTASLVIYGENNPTTDAGKFVTELTRLSKFVLKHLTDKKARGETLTRSEEKVLSGSNALGNQGARGTRYNQPHEMLAHGMTSNFMQEVLESIPYKGRRSVMSKFVEAIRTVLGLSPRTETALSQVIYLSEQLLNTSLGPIQSSTATRGPIQATAGPVNVPAPGQPYTLPKLTKLQAPQTTAQQVKTVVGKVQKNWNDNDFWTRFRIAAVDPTSGLAQTLKSLPVFQNGQLRADMLIRSFNQVINLIKNGLQSGIPVVNNDGTIIIQQDPANLARSQLVADNLDKNAVVQGSGMTGREFVGEVARILRGKEILKIDAQRRAKAAQMLAVAKSKIQQAKQAKAANAPLNVVMKLVNEAKAIRARYREDLHVNRERQVTQAHINWAEQQMQAVPEMQEVFDIWGKTTNSLIDLWENAGLLSPAQAAYYRSMKSYVPLYAAREDLAPLKQEGYTGKAGGTKTVRELEHLSGSELQRNIWENMDKHYASMIAAAYQNQTRKVAVGQLKALGAAKIAAKPTDPDVNLRYRDPTDPNADANGYVSVILDNPNDLAAFQIMNYEMGPLLKALSATTQVLRTTALLNPMYWIKQLIRDPLHATMVANSGIVTPFHAVAEYAKILANNSAEAKFLASRGVIGQVDSTIDIHQFLKQAGTQKLNQTVLDKMLHKVMQAHEASDAATRVAIFKKARDQGLKQGMSVDEANDYGAFRARESINFSVHGNSKTLHALRHMIPFFSASITSMDTLYRAATGYGLNPEEKAEAQRLFMSRAAIMVVLSTLYAMSLQDDDEYKKLPDNVKDNNWLMPNPWGTDGKSFIKVPVPFEVGFFFKTLPEASVRYMSGTSTGKEYLHSVVDGIRHNLPGEGIIIPQGAKPILEAVTNYSFYSRRPIEGMSDQALPVASRGPNAGEAAKALSAMGLDKAGLSPAMIDHLTQAYFAELGTFTMGVASSMIAEANGKVPPTKNIEEQPFFKSFMTNPNTSSAATDFYEITHTSQEVVNQFNRLVSQGRKEEAQTYMADEENKKRYAAAPVLRNLQNQMNLIRKRVNYLKAQNDMDPDARQAQINKLMDQYDQVAKKGYLVLEKAGIER
jgi:muconolactone delta-isomerase